eukprot:scaffold2590_cov160-Amphora_coffeaeformis.AAC.11
MSFRVFQSQVLVHVVKGSAIAKGDRTGQGDGLDQHIPTRGWCRRREGVAAARRRPRSIILPHAQYDE